MRPPNVSTLTYGCGSWHPGAYLAQVGSVLAPFGLVRLDGNQRFPERIEALEVNEHY